MSEIEAANLKFMTAFGKQDATGLSELYTEDCKLMPTGTDVLFGREGAYVCVVSPDSHFLCESLAPRD